MEGVDGVDDVEGGGKSGRRCGWCGRGGWGWTGWMWVDGADGVRGGVYGDMGVGWMGCKSKMRLAAPRLPTPPCQQTPPSPTFGIASTQDGHPCNHPGCCPGKPSLHTAHHMPTPATPSPHCHIPPSNTQLHELEANLTTKTLLRKSCSNQAMVRARVRHLAQATNMEPWRPRF